MPQDRFADPLPPTPDIDYVPSFDALARVELEIRRRGPSAHLLLRRAMLCTAIGNYDAALEAARDAVTAAPREPEAHFQEGLAWLWLARVQAGLAPLGPGGGEPRQEDLRELLGSAHEAFCAAASAARDDADAEASVAWLEQVLESDDLAVALGRSA